MILFKFVFKHRFFHALSVFFAFLFLGSCTPFVTREYNLNESFQDIIVRRQGVWGAYTRAEFILEGNFSGYGYLYLLWQRPETIDSNDWGRYGYRKNVQGNFRESFVSIWYIDIVGVVFIPIEPGEGNLRIRFRLRL